MIPAILRLAYPFGCLVVVLGFKGELRTARFVSLKTTVDYFVIRTGGGLEILFG